MSVMAKKRRTSGEHKVPRKPIQVPETWLILARSLAAEQKQPTLWYILQLIAEKADAKGKDRPKLPWEEEGGTK